MCICISAIDDVIMCVYCIYVMPYVILRVCCQSVSLCVI